MLRLIQCCFNALPTFVTTLYLRSYTRKRVLYVQAALSRELKGWRAPIAGNKRASFQESGLCAGNADCLPQELRLLKTANRFAVIAAMTTPLPPRVPAESMREHCARQYYC